MPPGPGGSSRARWSARGAGEHPRRQRSQRLGHRVGKGLGEGQARSPGAGRAAAPAPPARPPPDLPGSSRYGPATPCRTHPPRAAARAGRPVPDAAPRPPSETCTNAAVTRACAAAAAALSRSSSPAGPAAHACARSASWAVPQSMPRDPSPPSAATIAPTRDAPPPARICSFTCTIMLRSDTGQGVGQGIFSGFSSDPHLPQRPDSSRSPSMASLDSSTTKAHQTTDRERSPAIRPQATCPQTYPGQRALV